MVALKTPNFEATPTSNQQISARLNHHIKYLGQRWPTLPPPLLLSVSPHPCLKTVATSAPNRLWGMEAMRNTDTMLPDPHYLMKTGTVMPTEPYHKVPPTLFAIQYPLAIGVTT